MKTFLTKHFKHANYHQNKYVFLYIYYLNILQFRYILLFLIIIDTV